MANKALFLDRDGVINRDDGYVSAVEDFHFIDGIFELCRTAVVRGYLVVVVTNQSGIERGYFSDDDFQTLTAWMVEEFACREIPIAEVFYCPTLSGPDRKPLPGMFEKAREKFGLDMAASLSLGDKERDIEAARRAGVGVNVLFVPNGIENDSENGPQSRADHVINQLCAMEKLL